MKKVDRRSYHRDYYLKNLDRYKRRNTRSRQDKSEYLRTIKSVPCMDCGQTYPPYVMDLDHRPGTKKLYNPNEMTTKAGWGALEAEVAKCDVVCSNCHRVRTHTRLAAQ